MAKTTRRPNSIVASAARVTAGSKRGIAPKDQGWQSEAWEMLDSVGELEFYRQWYSNALSRCTLTVVEDLDGPTGTKVRPATDPTVLAAMDALFDGESGQGMMLAGMASHMAIAGETWLCGLLEPPGDPSIDTWRVLSKDEVKQEGSLWVIDRGDGATEKYTDEQVYLTRIWRPHPRKAVQAHSAVRSALPILRELVGLTKRVAADIDSRLKGAGILWVPSEVSFSSPAPGADPGDDVEMDPFLEELLNTMSAALTDQGSAAAMAPILARIPGQYIQYMKDALMSFTTPLDEKAQSLRSEALSRLANALDVPAEILLGMADINHWTGWLLDDNAIKMHIEPLLGTITHGLTTRYLWPCLQGASEVLDPSLRRFRIVGDTSALRQRPNLSADAQSLWNVDGITNAALARETGFSDGDILKPGSDEWKLRTLAKLALSANPDIAGAALSALGIDLDLPAAAPTVDAGEEAAPAVTQGVDARRALPSTPDQSQAAAVLAVSEVLVTRAVERGWNKVGNRGRARRPVPGDRLDTALADAWSALPRVSALLAVDERNLKSVLDRYARHLLETGRDHDPRVLARGLVDVLSTKAIG